MRVRYPFCLFLAAAALLSSASPAGADPLNLILPTSNDALLRGDEPSFYQYTDRTFDGRRSHPWQGGQYGFVRNPRHTSAGIVYTRFHEGVDIRAVYRDRYNEPLDTVRSIDDGYVVYVNNNEHHSSYGKYVVVEHWWSGSPFYSLYAHLDRVEVERGSRIRQGDRIGKLGYTGPGIDRRRAHLHFEINMLLNRNFGEWYDDNYRSRNRHDVFNGINLAGIDVAELYLALERDPLLTIEEFLTRHEPYFTVAIPNEGALDLTDRYAWLVDWSQREPGGLPVQSWDVSFTSSGVPTRITPSNLKVDGPQVTMVESSVLPYKYVTSGRIAGSGGSYYLSGSGRRYAALIALQGDRQTIVEFDRPRVEAVSDGERRLRTW